MSAHFTPWGTPRPCWHCQHFDRLDACGAALCTLQGGPRRRALPERGCSAWVREPGADDEAGPPGATADRGGRVGDQLSTVAQSKHWRGG
jgi:hypothetical protein